MLTDDLKVAILQAAIEGKITTSLPSDTKVMICSKNTDSPYDIPNKWEWVFLNEVIDIKNGFTPKRSIAEYWNEKDIPWFTVEDIHEQGRYISYTQQFISKKALGESDSRIIPKHTVLLCCTSATIGSYAMAEIELTTNQQWNGLVIKDCCKESLSSDYVFIWVQTLKDRLVSKGGSTTFPFISVKKLGQFMMPVPPIEEQQRIVDCVNEFMVKIDEYAKIEQEIIALKASFPKDLRSSIIQAAMQGRLTEQLDMDTNVEEQIKRIEIEREKLIGDKKYKEDKKLRPLSDDEIPFDIPDTWRWIKLGYCSSYGQTKEKASAEDVKSGKWALDLEDIEKITGRVLQRIPANKRHINGDKLRFKKGDILYSKLRPYLLKILIADDDGICTPELIPFSMIGGINPRYILWVLRSPHVDYKINAVTYGVKMPRVGTETMLNLLIPLPPIEEQQRIVDKLESLLPLCESIMGED